MNNIGNYKVISFPASRIATFDIGAVSKMKHQIKALVEIDVTKAHQLITEMKKKQPKISFHSWLIKCISQIVEEYPELHGIRKGNRSLVLFDDVDISIMIERVIQGKKVPLPYVIRQANRKSMVEISDEVRNSQLQNVDHEGDYVLGKTKSRYWMRLYYWLPGFLRRMIWRNIIQNAFITKQNMGTVMITSVGMVGKITGWVIPETVHPLSFAIGSIIKKPGIYENRIEVREYLHMTASVDHDVIDGAPAIRALSKLVRILESGKGLWMKSESKEPSR